MPLPRVDKRFYRTGEAIRRWVLVIFETQQRFPPQTAQDCMKGLVNSCRDVGKRNRSPKYFSINCVPLGMSIDFTDVIRYHNGHGKIRDSLKSVGMECINKLGGPPNLFVVILPEGGSEIYTEVKQCVALYGFVRYELIWLLALGTLRLVSLL